MMITIIIVQRDWALYSKVRVRTCVFSLFFITTFELSKEGREKNRAWREYILSSASFPSFILCVYPFFFFTPLNFGRLLKISVANFVRMFEVALFFQFGFFVSASYKLLFGGIMTTIMKVVPKTNQYTHTHTPYSELSTWETINLPSNFGLGQINLLQIISKAIKHDRRLILCAHTERAESQTSSSMVRSSGRRHADRRAHTGDGKFVTKWHLFA